MKTLQIVSLALCAAVLTAGAQSSQKTPFLNPNLSPEQRAEDIVIA